MTASECLAALTAGVLHVSRQRSLTLTQKVWVALYKCVAILGYYSGKCASLRRTSVTVLARKAPSVCQWNRLVCGDAPAAVLPLLAVIIPVYATTQQDVALLQRALRHLARQEGRPPTHVVLVDDASPRSLNVSYAGGGQLVLLRLSVNSGPAVARNVGLAWVAAQGVSVACLLDADCSPGPGWLAAMAAAQAAEPGIVCGRTFACQPDTAVGMYHDVCGTLNGRQLEDGSLLYGCTCNMSLSITALHGLAFDTSFPSAAFEDVEFCVRARKRNVRLTYCAGAVVQHSFAPGANGLYKQFFRYGMFERHMCAKHPEYMSWLSVSREISSFGGLPVVLAAGNGGAAAGEPRGLSTADAGVHAAGSKGGPGASTAHLF